MEIKKEGLLFMMCQGCNNPLIVDPDYELELVKVGYFKCPDCEEIQAISYKMKDYILETTNKLG